MQGPTSGRGVASRNGTTFAVARGYVSAMTLRLAPLALLLAACGPGSGRVPDVEPGPDALATLTIGGQPIDLASGRHFFALPASSLGRTSTVQAVPHDPDAVVTLRWETATGALLADDAQSPLGLAADQRLIVELDGDRWMVSFPPDSLPPVTVEGDPIDDFFLLTPRDYTVDGLPAPFDQALLVVDGHGTPVWWLRTLTAAFDFRVSGDGQFTVNTAIDPALGFNTHAFDPSSGTITGIWGPSTPDHWESPRVDAHEFQLRADGSHLATITGNTVEDLSPWGGLPQQQMWHSGVREHAADGTLLAEWTVEGNIDLDGLPQPVLDQLESDRPWRYDHINSVQDLGGTWLISLRSPNQVAVVDPATGDYVWRLGGSTSDLQFVDDPRGGFVGQHSARIFEPDRLMVFDNGTNFDSPTTGDARIVEYALDLDGGTATQIWEYALPGSGGVEYAGLIQRRPDDSTVIGWGSLQTQNGERSPSVTVLHPDRSWRCHLRLPAGMYTYRAYAFSGDPFTGVWDPASFP